MVTVLACRREKACGLREGTVRRGERGRALSLPPLSLSLSLSLYCYTALTVAEKVTEIRIWPTFIVPYYRRFAAALMTLRPPQPFLRQRTECMLEEPSVIWRRLVIA